jgi:hypothetical protein
VYSPTLSEPWIRYYLTHLKSVASGSPIIAILNLKTPDKLSAEQLAEYETRHRRNALVQQELIKLAMAQDQDAKAISLLENYNTILLTRWGSETLADLQLKQGDEQAWKATLDRFLQEGVDSGLGHPIINTRMANYYMSKPPEVTRVMGSTRHRTACITRGRQRREKKLLAPRQNAMRIRLPR